MRLHTPPLSLLMFVGMINTCIPFRPAQHNSLMSQNKARGKRKIKLQEHSYNLRGFEVLKNFFLHQSPQHYFDFFFSGLFCCGFVWMCFFLMNECCIICFSPAKTFMYFHALLDNKLLNAVCSVSLILL